MTGMTPAWLILRDWWHIRPSSSSDYLFEYCTGILRSPSVIQMTKRMVAE